MQNKNAFVSQKEVPFPANCTLVSKTDTKGITTYVSDTFVDISGYSREELVGTSHNIVRHPDMPPQAFKWLWDTLKAGRPWRGIVKNRCKNGDHYWVSATVVPLMDEGKFTGYMSVRRAPTREQISSAEALYRELNQSGAEIESKYEGWKFKNWPLKSKLQLVIQGVLLAILTIAQIYVQSSLDDGDDGVLKTQLIFGQVGLHVLLFFAIGYVAVKFILRPLSVVNKEFSHIMQGDLDAELDISIRDEIGDLLCKTQTMNAYLRTMVDEVVSAGENMQVLIREVDSRVSQVAANALTEQDHVQAIAATMEEFSQSVAGVSDMATDSSTDAYAMQQIVEENNRNMELSIIASNKVAETVQCSSKTITNLGDSIQKIGVIANAIKEIADQTNLLALNAAIEAARAGEQGRGFAVVADEVRKLAERTSSSTKDIASTISEIGAISDSAVQTMQDAVTEVQSGIKLIRKNGDGLKEIMSAAVSVAGRIDHIATSAKEQSTAGHEVANSLEGISILVDNNASTAMEAKKVADGLTESAVTLKKAGYPLTKSAMVKVTFLSSTREKRV